LISGGSDDSFPLFRRKEKVEEQAAMIRDFTEKLESVKGEKSRSEARIAGHRAETVKLNGQIEDLAEEIDELQRKLSEVDFEQRTLTSDYNRLEKERHTLTDKLEGIRHRQYVLGLDFSQLANQKDALVTDMDRAGSELSEFERAASQAMEHVSRLHVSTIEARSKAQQAESRINHINEIRNDISMTIDLKTEEIAEARSTIENSAQRTEELELELKSLFENREKLTQRQSSLRTVQSEVMARVNQKEKQTREVRDAREAVLEEMHQLEIRLNSTDSEIKGIRDRILEEYEIDINTVQADRPDESISDDQARQHLQEQKEKLKKFGAVNLLALEEYQEAFDREKFLGEQLTDLETAKRDLQTTINKINQTARQLFFETFNQVRQNFQGLFVELFKGGEADIRLEDPSDPLDSNIEITARPQGKKILSITQMSGGERALTAISLLFSLYLVKPSPFCILDEIDAPLDDANCHRFLRIIRNFSKHTQFITITHNKITMEAADNLYGVTMQEPGISQLVAVKFTEEDEYTIDDHAPETEDHPVPPPPQEEPEPEPEPARDQLPGQIQDRINPAVNISPDDEN
jgi:chromosome segregation protein